MLCPPLLTLSHLPFPLQSPLQLPSQQGFSLLGRVRLTVLSVELRLILKQEQVTVMYRLKSLRAGSIVPDVLGLEEVYVSDILHGNLVDVLYLYVL